MFYLVRHGETDYSERNTKIYQGFGVNLAPLSNKGCKQIKNTSKDSRLRNADLILSSPYTRALQTAAIISKKLKTKIVVETDLHEWKANKHYYYENDEQADNNYKEFVEFSGVYRDGIEKDWESIEMLRTRFLGVLSRYIKYDKVIVCCHGVIIQSVCDGYHSRCGEIVEYELAL